MKLEIYKSTQMFLEDYQDRLLREEARHQLLLANLLHYQDASTLTKDNVFGVVKDKKTIHLIFLNAYPYNLQLHAFTDAVQSYDILVDYLLSNHIVIQGVNGPDKDVENFIKAYGLKNQAKEFRHYLGMDIMMLEKVIGQRKKNLSLQLAKKEHLDTLFDYMLGFHKDCFQEAADQAKIRQTVSDAIHTKRQYILLDEDNHIVSIAMLAKRKLIRGVCISGVYTPDKYRYKGYSTYLMSHLCTLLLRKGYEYVTLFVDKSNPISNRVYEKVGFKIIQNNYDYRLKEKTNNEQT